METTARTPSDLSVRVPAPLHRALAAIVRVVTFVACAVLLSALMMRLQMAMADSTEPPCCSAAEMHSPALSAGR